MRTSLLVICFCATAAAADVAGHWEGALPPNNGPTRMAFDLAHDSQGHWIASFAVPERNVSGLLVTELSVDGARVKFTVPDVPGHAAFDLTLRDDRLAGTLSVKGLSIPFEMKRTGEAKVTLIAPSPAVSVALEGDWEGALDIPGKDARVVVFHFRNQSDHTVTATIDVPSQGGFGLPLMDVIQKGREVEFSVRIYGGHFKGTLEGNQLAGEWVQSPNQPALACRMHKKQ